MYFFCYKVVIDLFVTNIINIYNFKLNLNIFFGYKVKNKYYFYSDEEIYQ